MILHENVYSTGDVAAIFGCAAKTAAKWMDNGMLVCFRIPGSKDRRVTTNAVNDFIFAQGEPASTALYERFNEFRARKSDARTARSRRKATKESATWAERKARKAKGAVARMVEATTGSQPDGIEHAKQEVA